jgi:hypothetical protein
LSNLCARSGCSIPQAQYQGRVLVVVEVAAVLDLLARKDEELLVTGDADFVLDQVLNGGD